MPEVYYSTVIEAPADRVWAEIRAFDHYSWSGVEAQTVMEDGRLGDQVGGIRSILLPDGNVRRQKLVALSDHARRFSYTICDPPYLPLRNFLATLQVEDVVDGNRAFVKWRAAYDCELAVEESLREQLTSRGFAVWLGSLRKLMEKR